MFTKLKLYLCLNIQIKPSQQDRGSLSAADFNNFIRESNVKPSPFKVADQPVVTQNVLDDVNSLFILKAKGKIANSENKQGVKENAMRHIYDLVCHISGFIKRKMLLVNEKYQDDSDEEDDIIPENDKDIDYLKTIHTDISSKISKDVRILLLNSQNRVLGDMQKEFINEVFVNCDKKNCIFSHSFDKALWFKNSSKDNVVTIINDFTKITNKLFTTLEDLKTENAEKQLNSLSSDLKFALINETGLKMIEWIQKFRDIEEQLAQQLELDLSIDQAYKPNEEIHFSKLTPFASLDEQPSTIREFLVLFKSEFNILGNVLSFTIQEELESIKDASKAAKGLYQNYGRYIKHAKQILEIVIQKLLEEVKTKVLKGLDQDNEVRMISEDACLLYLHTLKEFSNVINPRVVQVSQLFEAKIRYPVENKITPYVLAADSIIQKSKGFSLETWETKSKLYFNECWKAILDSKLLIIGAATRDSFDIILEELSKKVDSMRSTNATKTLNMIVSTPLTNIRSCIFELLEIVCSFLIKAYDIWGTDIQGLFVPRLISHIISTQSDCLTQYEFELNPMILKQIYFEFEFLFEIASTPIANNTLLDQKASELSQKILQLILKSIAKQENKKLVIKNQIEEKDVFNEEEQVKMSKSLRSLKLIHEFNFFVLF